MKRPAGKEGSGNLYVRNLSFVDHGVIYNNRIVPR